MRSLQAAGRVTQPESPSGEAAHFRALEQLYRSAPINRLFRSDLVITEAGRSRIDFDVDESQFHAAGAVHGTVYFKMLDDAAFFAANSLEQTFFMLTTSFTTYLTRPVSEGKIRSVGKVVHRNRSQSIVEAVVWNDEGQEIGRGNGLMVRGKAPLAGARGYDT